MHTAPLPPQTLRSNIARIVRFKLPSLFVLFGLAALTMLVGCHSLFNRKKEEQFEKDAKRWHEIFSAPDRPRLVGEVSGATGAKSHRYYSLGLVNGLRGTGGIVRPSAQRQFMLDEMRRREVLHPETFLDSPLTAVANLLVFGNPCESKGDSTDVIVECSPESVATDFREGFVMPAMLREGVVLDRLRTTNDKVKASGEIVLFPTSYTGEAEVNLLRGIIIGGGKLLDVPKISIIVEKDYRHVYTTRAIEKAINTRFYLQDASRQHSVATAKDDTRILIESIPKYRWDPVHFVNVLMSTAFNEEESEVAERVQGCRRLLLSRETAQRGAAELESLATPAAREVLLEGIASADTEVRFHAAYALAYLDRVESIPVLVSIARSERAFRHLCLTGLAINEHASARQALEDMLQESEPELRYGAVWALRQKNPRDPAVAGEPIGDLCNVMVIPSQTPLIAVSLETKKEVVCFGRATQVQLVQPAMPTPHLKLIPIDNNQIRIAKRQLDGEMLETTVSNDLLAILRGLPFVGGNYGDVVFTIEELSKSGQLACRAAMNPRPRAGRVFERTDMTAANGSELLRIDRNTNSSQGKESSWWNFASFLKPKSSSTKSFQVRTTESSDSKDSE